MRAIVVGAGASGLFASIILAQGGAEVLLFEKESRPAKKLLITGKGRCNLTNNCDRDEILKNIPRNPRFMYSALMGLDAQGIMSFFEELGVKLKVERGRRVFPESDKASEIAEALIDRANALGVELIHERVTDILTDGEKAGGVKCGGREYKSDAVIVATGGKSYPKTGSTGDGYKFAERLGIKVTPLTPSLVPIVTDNSDKAELSGLSLRNVTLKLYEEGKKNPVFEELGEMLFTHFGVSGPLVLSSSAHMSDDKKYFYKIDLKPGLDFEKLDKRLLRDFSENPNRAISNTLKKLLPHTLILPVLEAAKIDRSAQVNSVTKAQRLRLAEVVKGFRLGIVSKRPIEEAIVTRGGIETSELNPKTMESKRYKGLYFIGEVIDVDGYTGGFNLTIAFSTANAASRRGNS